MHAHIEGGSCAETDSFHVLTIRAACSGSTDAVIRASRVRGGGVITRVDWINPHAYVYLDVKDANGAVVKWSLETLPPLMARKGGMTKDMLPVGQTITIGGFGSKDGSKMAWIKKITFADGKVLQVTAEDNQEASQK